jgi:glucosamine kinase
MKLIGDSGATTTDWVIYDPKTKQQTAFKTEGLSPVYMNDDEIRHVLFSEVLPHLNDQQVDEICFYGAGCARGSRRARMTDIFTDVFGAAEIMIEGDLVAVARALSGNDRGIIAILGTGSASGLCDHGDIVDQVKSLGFYIGDEGSAAHLGQLVLQAYFYRDMPDDLNQSFENMYGERIPVITEELYASSTPSRYAGDFAKFCYEHREHEFVQNLIRKNFADFVAAHIVKYEDYKNLPFSAIGSLAHHFADELTAVLTDSGITVKTIVQNPIKKLVEFHTK